MTFELVGKIAACIGAVGLGVLIAWVFIALLTRLVDKGLRILRPDALTHAFGLVVGLRLGRKSHTGFAARKLAKALLQAYDGQRGLEESVHEHIIALRDERIKKESTIKP